MTTQSLIDSALKEFDEKFSKEIHDLMADFMIDLCEQSGHPKDCHICQPSNRLWAKNWKKFMFLASQIATAAKEEGAREAFERSTVIFNTVHCKNCQKKAKKLLDFLKKEEVHE